MLEVLPAAASSRGEEPEAYRYRRGAFCMTTAEAADFYWMVIFVPSAVLFGASLTYLAAATKTGDEKDLQENHGLSNGKSREHFELHGLDLSEKEYKAEVSVHNSSGVTTVAGGKSNILGYRDGPSEDAKFSTDFDVVYVNKMGSLLVVDRGNAALRKIALAQEDYTYQDFSLLSSEKDAASRAHSKNLSTFYGRDIYY